MMNSNLAYANPQKMRAVAYIRVSTDKEEQKSSLINQRSFFETFIEQRGDTLTRIYCDDGKSATKMENRKALNEMLRDARAHKFDRVYVKDVSRLFRNVKNFVNVMSELYELGINIYYVDLGGTNVDPVILNLFATLAESESEKMSTRIKFAKNLSKQKGIVPNFVFGYDLIDKWTMEPNPEEAETVRFIFNRYTEDGWGQARIAKYLHENGVKTKKNKKDAWSNATVGKILTNQIYIGKVVNGRQTTKGPLTNQRDKHSEEDWIVVERPEFRIISDEQFEKAQRLRKENAARYPTLGTKSEKHIFSNLIKCGSCGFSYRRVQRKYSENTPVRAWWVCSHRSVYGSDRCESEHIRIDEDWLLNSIRQLLGSMVRDKQKFCAMAEQKCNAIIQEYLGSTLGLTVDELKEQIDGLEKERGRIKEMARRGIITLDEAEQDMLPLNARVEKLRFKLNEADKSLEVMKQVKKRLSAFVSDFSAFTLTENLTNADLKKIIDKIVVKSKEEIYVYFKIGGEYDEVFTVPVRLTETVETDTNVEHGTQGHFRTAAPF